MPQQHEGFTHIENAVEKWGRNRNWWYLQVREGKLTGYKIPGEKGTFLRDEEVAAYLKPQPLERPRDDVQSG